MKTLEIEGNEKMPNILCDADKGLIEIKGLSIPEDPLELYGTVLEWLNEYTQNVNGPTTANVYLEYFNTSSSKYILKVFNLLSDIHQNSNQDVVVNWYFEEDDSDMQEVGEDYQAIVKLPFNMIAV